jgi:single-stranded-DNA-specific exonuclease
MEVARIRENISAYHLGFQLGPRLNAAGRMGDAMYALELLLTDDDDRARSLARHLDQANRRRQKVESDILQAALDQIEFDEERDYGLVVADTEWHAGVIGIVASRLCTRFRRPVVVIALNEDGSGRGSCRSLDAFDMVRGLDACSSVLTRWGGHHMAAGLELAPGRLREFRELFNETARQALLDADLRPVQRIDTWVDMEHINDRLWNEMQQMAPFGAEHPSPVLALARVEVMGKPRVVGNGHLRMTVRNERGRLSGIGFGMGDRELPADGMLDIAFRLHRNYFRGVSSLQMQIQDFRPSDAAFRA